MYLVILVALKYSCWSYCICCIGKYNGTATGSILNRYWLQRQQVDAFSVTSGHFNDLCAHGRAGFSSWSVFLNTVLPTSDTTNAIELLWVLGLMQITLVIASRWDL
eukprot:4611554-Amphidinium_carterae.1